MNSREADQAVASLKQLLGIEADLNAANAIEQIEKAIVDRGYLPEEKIVAFKAAKQKDGKYIIDPKDNELIKAVKATINLLVAVNAINLDVLEDLRVYVDDNKENKIGYLKKLFNLGATAVKGVEQLKQFRQEMNVFLFYLGRFNSLMPDFTGIQATAYTKIQDLQDAFSNLEINHVKKVVDKKLEKTRQENLDRLIPAMSGANDIYQAISSFGLKTNIQALVQITDKLSIVGDKDYDSQQKRFTAPIEDFKIIYNLCHNIDEHIDECERLLRKVTTQYPHVANLKWTDLSENDRNDFIKLDKNLKEVNANLSQLMSLCDKYPLLKKISDRNADLFKQQKQVLSNWTKSLDSANIAKLSLGVEGALALVNEVVDNNITQAIRDAYFQADKNLYVMPQDVNKVTDSQFNLMLLHNIDVHAKAVLQGLEVAKNKFFPANVSEMLSVLKVVGELVADFKKIKQEGLKGDVVALLRRDLQVVFGQAIDMLRSMAIVAAEAELKLGLKEQSLLSYLDPVRKNISSMLDLVGVKMTIPLPLYESERKKANGYVEEESRKHRKLLKRTRKELSKGPLTLDEMLKYISLLDQTGLYSASIYAEKLREHIDQITGMDLLEAEIKLRESAIFKAVQLQEMITSQSLLLARTSQVYDMNFSDDVKAKIKELRELYVMRDSLQGMVQKINEAQSDPAKLAAISVNHFAIVTEGFFAKRTTYKLVSGEKLLSAGSKEQFKQLRIAVLSEIAPQELSVSLYSSQVGSGDDPLTRSLIELDETKFLTAITMDQSAEALKHVEELAPLDDKDYRIVQGIIDNVKGSVVLSSEATRKQLIEKFSPILSDDIVNLSGLAVYAIDAGDKPLMAVVKSTYNTMVEFERLMLLVNKLQRVLGGGYLGYRKIPKLIDEIKDAAKSLKGQVGGVNEKLTVLRELVMKHAIHLDVVNPFSMMESSFKQFYDQFQGLDLFIRSGLIKKLLPDLVDDVNKSFKYGGELEADSAGLIESVTKESENELALSVDLNKSVSTDINVNALVEWAKEQLNSRIADSSYRDSIAALVEAYNKLISAMNGADNYAHGHPITGLFFVISNLYSAWSLINDSKVMDLADKAKHHAAMKFLRLKELLNKKIKDCVGQVSPVLDRMRREVVLSEQSLGLKDGVLLSPLNDYVEKFNQLVAGYSAHSLASNYETVPLMDVEDSQLSETAPVLIESALSAYLRWDSVNNELNEKKIRALIIACVEYKHHLAGALHKELLRAFPQNDYHIDLSSRFISLDSHLAKLDPVLKLTIDKYNAVHDLQNILQSPRSNLQNKITDFSKALRQRQALISESRTSSGMYFLKTVLTILSFGFVALFGLWDERRVRGKQVSDRMERILLVGMDEDKRRVP